MRTSTEPSARSSRPRSPAPSGSASTTRSPSLPSCRRPDGASVYDVHGATLYTSAKVLSAENELLALAARSGGHALADVRVEVAIAASAAKGFELNDAQAAMVRDLATSGAVVQLALAPAGTGKTTTMSVLADAWTEGGGQVIGLAPSAQAAHELGQAITGHTDTLAKLTWTLANESSAEWPRWIREIGPSSMVIIDEAGQAATTELAAAVRYVAERGGVVRLIGDDQQLAAVGAGGILRDIQQQYGASTLSEVRRFDDPAEAAATLAVREGDAGALGFYADNARIHVGDLGAVADQAYDAWAADRAAGLDAVLLAPTRDLVSQLNARARADRLSTTPMEDGLEVDLADGNRASAGDVIVTRRNSRRLVISRSNWVKNGDRWRVEQVLAGGSLVARHVELGRSVELPADYVAEHVQLGYATTVHGAQGMTADTRPPRRDRRGDAPDALRRRLARASGEPHLPRHRLRRRPAQPHRPEGAPPADRDRRPGRDPRARRIRPLRHDHAAGGSVLRDSAARRGHALPRRTGVRGRGGTRRRRPRQRRPGRRSDLAGTHRGTGVPHSARTSGAPCPGRRGPCRRATRRRRHP